MADKILLDTNAVIAYFADDSAAYARFEEAIEIFVAATVVGELFYGAQYSAQSKSNLARVDAFVSTNPVLECDLETARRFGLVKAALRAQGRLIPDNDVCIAATALQHVLTLLTNDARFAEVDGLAVLGW